MSLQTSIEKIWYSGSPWLTLLKPLSLVFYLIVQSKRSLYLNGLFKTYRFEKPVLVVGNINVGGTGKTPFIAHLVNRLQQHGIKVGIVSRGYKSQQEQLPHQVTDEDTATLVGDEALMQFKQLNIPVVIDANRSRAVEYLLKNNSVDLVISDDGLQHYAMSRDIEVVLVDGERQFGNQMILPFGPLREPVSRLESVDFVIQNGAQPAQYANWKFDLEAVTFVHLNSGKEFPLTQFKNIPVQAVAAIGNPQRFYTLLAKYCKIKATKNMPDHHLFSAQDFDYSKDGIVIMTQKDAVKCNHFSKDNWYYLKIRLKLEQSLEEALLIQIKQTISSHY
ncbi:MAG: tetraacyldisaccharide 4'-kinase [Enterobacterales bacterium]|nr:tetraacyldisaccharide 4'-kinase [Enterobacterales bacterium]